MPPTTRKQYQLDTAPDHERANLVLSEANNKLQAEVLSLRDEIRSLNKETARLKRANTNPKRQKDTFKESKQATKGSQQRKYKSTETTARRLQKENQHYKQLLQEKDQELEEKEQQMEERDEDNMKLKQKVAASSRLDNQITDETFRETMSYAYTTVHDCFYGVFRRRDFSESAGQNLESRQTDCSGDVDVKLSEWQDDLNAYLPDHKDNPSEDKLHLCIATVGYILVAAVNTKNVFGSPFTDQIEAATTFWRNIPEPQTIKTRKKITQWLSLTKEVLTDKNRESMDKAREYILEDVLDKIKEFLEELTDLKVTDDMREELSEGLSPLLETMSMLPYQRWQYIFDMVPVVDREDQTFFDHSKMDGMFAEKTGMVKASLFPQLCRLEWNGRDQDFNHTIVCKARVAVKSDPSSITDGMMEDKVMSGGIDDGTKIELEAAGNLGADVINKILESMGQERGQNEDQHDMEEKDVGEHIDEDPLTYALRAESDISVERFETPEGDPSESVIPDSFDRDEEETMGQSRGWPA
ncbi:hypothetical protein KCU64_g9158, partial [Aureobasidium melanogenum]